MFCGYCFASDKSSLRSSSVPSATVTKMTISNAIFTEIFATVKIIETSTFLGVIPSDWTFDTRFHACFYDNLAGGNVDFDERITESVRIKKRTKKDTKFQTIFEKKINSNSDFQIEFLDYKQPYGEVEYAYVPIIAGGENKYITTKALSSFDKPFLIERNESYSLDTNFKYSESINYENAMIKPFGRKYPVSVVNGNTGYKSGDIECTFINVDGCEFDTENAKEYRDNILNMLTNNNAKLFKDTDGTLLMININGNITESDRNYVYHNNNGFYLVNTKFSWTETGNAYSTGDLYDNNFIDTDVDRQVT